MFLVLPRYNEVRSTLLVALPLTQQGFAAFVRAETDGGTCYCWSCYGTRRSDSYYYNDGLGRDACGCLASGAAFLMGLSGSLVALLDTV